MEGLVSQEPRDFQVGLDPEDTKESKAGLVRKDFKGFLGYLAKMVWRVSKDSKELPEISLGSMTNLRETREPRDFLDFMAFKDKRGLRVLWDLRVLMAGRAERVSEDLPDPMVLQEDQECQENLDL